MKIKDAIERQNNAAKMLNTFEALEVVRKELKEGVPPGLSTGWTTLNPYFTFPPRGQLNVVTGFPQSGKSEWMDSLALNMAVKHGWKIFYYSPENYPSQRHLQKLCSKFINKPFHGKWNGWENVNEKDLDLFDKLIAEHYSFVDCHINTATVDEILNSIFIECRNHKVDMAIVDPWNKIEVAKAPGMNEREFIGKSLTRIQMFARESGIQFFIVAHPTKPAKNKTGGYNSLTLYDISGSADWYNMTDNGFIIHRDWNDKTGDKNESQLKIAKVKDEWYGKCGEILMRFEPATNRYHIDKQVYKSRGEEKQLAM